MKTNNVLPKVDEAWSAKLQQLFGFSSCLIVFLSAPGLLCSLSSAALLFDSSPEEAQLLKPTESDLQIAQEWTFRPRVGIHTEGSYTKVWFIKTARFVTYITFVEKHCD